mmetsp:Transcript_5709/g.9734  ORF Transcript_5709/g.9734 Transcript_5709/m.9734 type:complete len:97 (-) Transcript_5709:12-302(-)
MTLIVGRVAAKTLIVYFHFKIIVLTRYLMVARTNRVSVVLNAKMEASVMRVPVRRNWSSKYNVRTMLTVHQADATFLPGRFASKGQTQLRTFMSRL